MGWDDTLKYLVTQDNSQFQAAMGENNASLDRLGQAFSAVGQAIAAGAFGQAVKGMVSEFASSERAGAKLNAVLAATKQAAGLSAAEMKGLATQIQEATGVEDDLVVNAEAVLATFRNIKGDTFKAATEAMVDMSAVMEGDLKGSAVQLGKALNDPVTGISALSRVGVSFSDSQKALIENFQKTNDIASAQKVILDELASEFGGAAKEQGESFAGTLDKTNVAISDMKKSIGESLAPTIQNVAKGVKSFAATIEKVPAPVKASAVALVGVATVIPGVVASVNLLSSALGAGGLIGVFSNPVTGVLAVLAVATVAFMSFSAEAKKARESSAVSAMGLQNDSEAIRKNRAFEKNYGNKIAGLVNPIGELNVKNTNANDKVLAEQLDPVIAILYKQIERGTGSIDTYKKIAELEKRKADAKKRIKDGNADFMAAALESINTFQKAESLTNNELLNALEWTGSIKEIPQEKMQKVIAAYKKTKAYSDQASAEEEAKAREEKAKNDASDKIALDKWLADRQELIDAYKSQEQKLREALAEVKSFKKGTKAGSQEMAGLDQAETVIQKQLDDLLRKDNPFAAIKAQLDDERAQLASAFAEGFITEDSLATGNRAALEAFTAAALKLKGLLPEQKEAIRSAIEETKAFIAAEEEKLAKDQNKAQGLSWVAGKTGLDEKAVGKIFSAAGIGDDVAEWIGTHTSALDGLVSAYQSAFSQIKDTISAAMTAAAQAQIDALEKTIEKTDEAVSSQVSLMQSYGEDTTEIELRAAAQKAAAEEELQKKKQALVVKQFRLDQATSSAQAAMFTAVNVAKAGNPILAASIIALGIAQQTAIWAQSVPAAFNGGIVQGSPAGQIIKVGERSQSEVILPLRDEVLSRLGSGKKTVNITINAKNASARDVARELAQLQRQGVL